MKQRRTAFGKSAKHNLWTPCGCGQRAVYSANETWHHHAKYGKQRQWTYCAYFIILNYYICPATNTSLLRSPNIVYIMTYHAFNVINDGTAITCPIMEVIGQSWERAVTRQVSRISVVIFFLVTSTLNTGNWCLDAHRSLRCENNNTTSVNVWCRVVWTLWSAAAVIRVLSLWKPSPYLARNTGQRQRHQGSVRLFSLVPPLRAFICISRVSQMY